MNAHSSQVIDWVKGARPRTLPAALVPVMAGSCLAYRYRTGRSLGILGSHNRPGHDMFELSYCLAALVVSLAMQVGVNYANDYSDGIKGTDDDRVGPVRLVGSKLASPRAVKLAALTSFTIGAAVGLVLSIERAPWLIVVGAASIGAGWFYTGGKNPYGYRGFGELSVFIFFGLVATCGTQYVATGHFESVSILVGVTVGLCSIALLETNNLRDIVGDSQVGKKTLAVRLGDRRTRILFVGTLFWVEISTVVLSIIMRDAWVLLGLGGAPLAWVAGSRVTSGETGKGLVGVLKLVSMFQVVCGIGLSLGFLL